jgi:hypothetical protein
MAAVKKCSSKVNSKAVAKVDEPTPVRYETNAGMALRASVNGASVIQIFQNNLLGKETDINELMEGLQDNCKAVNEGNMKSVEAMLVSQAKALQTIFASLARRAHGQTQLKHYEAFLGLALKAQAQSRATITALVDLKYPRQATYVKQANIAHGAQQVNNGTAPQAEIQKYAHTPAPAKEIENPQNKLLEATHAEQSYRLDTRAPQKTKRSHQAVETVESVHRR